MRDIENDGADDDSRMIQTLREGVPDVALDDLRFERLARRVSAVGAQRLQKVRAARQKVRMQWAGSFVSAGLAASAIFALVLMHAMPGESAGSVTSATTSSVVSTTADSLRESRRELFAASMGEISEDEFVNNVWGQVDAESLLRGNRE